MPKEVIAEAASVEEALAEGINQLGLSREEVDFEVIEEPAKKHFGFGNAKPAKVRVFETANVSEISSTIVDEIIEDTNEPSQENFNSLEEADLTDEQIDTIADEAIATVKIIAEYCGAKNIEIEEYEGDEGEVILDIVGDDLAFLIGRHGRTIEALQTVTSAIVTKRMGVRFPIVVDVEGYRHRRKQKVIEIAMKAVERAERSGRPVSLRPMSPQERRMVHIAIREVQGVTSSSEGSGDNRHVVIIPNA